MGGAGRGELSLETSCAKYPLKCLLPSARIIITSFYLFSSATEHSFTYEAFMSSSEFLSGTLSWRAEQLDKEQAVDFPPAMGVSASEIFVSIHLPMYSGVILNADDWSALSISSRASGKQGVCNGPGYISPFVPWEKFVLWEGVRQLFAQQRALAHFESSH